MGTLNLNDILVTRLRRIPTAGGDVLHALKNSETSFNGFGEVYFSWIEQGAIKAWKCHQYMTLNLVVPMGEVSFVFHLTNQSNKFRIERIGLDRYARLTVPPGIWFGFQGRATGNSLIMNVADKEHDPNELKRISKSAFAYEWDK